MNPEEKWFTGSGYRYYIRARLRFLEFGLGASVKQADEVIELTRAAAAAAVELPKRSGKWPGRSAAHFLMGQAYRARYDAHGSLDDLTWSLRAIRQAIEEDPGQDRGRRLYLLANSLLDVVEMLKPGERPAAEHMKLIEQWLQEARPLLDAEEAAMCLSSLGLLKLQRYRHFGAPEDMIAAMKTLFAARDEATNDADRAAIYGNIGKASALAYNATDPRNVELGAQTVWAYDEAARISPANDPNHATHLMHQKMTRETFKLPPAAT